MVTSNIFFLNYRLLLFDDITEKFGVVLVVKYFILLFKSPNRQSKSFTEQGKLCKFVSFCIL